MKPQDKFGNPIFPRVFGRLRMIGEELENCDWRENQNKPNLFYKKVQGIMIFADMRGTENVPIWEEPYPLLYASPDDEAWKRRRALRMAMNELDLCEIPSRLSFFETAEPEGLYFGPDAELTDGSCKLCGKDFDRDGLFCSEGCETAFAELKELRRVERAQAQHMQCAVCRKSLEFFSKNTIKHHVSYEPEKTIYVCRSCHQKIHERRKSYPNLAPEMPSAWKTTSLLRRQVTKLEMQGEKGEATEKALPSMPCPKCSTLMEWREYRIPADQVLIGTVRTVPTAKGFAANTSLMKLC